MVDESEKLALPGCVRQFPFRCGHNLWRQASQPFFELGVNCMERCLARIPLVSNSRLQLPPVSMKRARAYYASGFQPCTGRANALAASALLTHRAPGIVQL